MNLGVPLRKPPAMVYEGHSNLRVKDHLPRVPILGLNSALFTGCRVCVTLLAARKTLTVTFCVAMLFLPTAPREVQCTSELKHRFGICSIEIQQRKSKGNFDRKSNIDCLL